MATKKSRYTTYIGECVGHVQKRVGKRLGNLKKKHNKENPLRDGKPLGGKGRLDEKSINTLQNYFGVAIRQNSHNLLEMKKAIGAVVYHCSETSNAEARHMFCSKEPNTSCKYQAGEIHEQCIPKIVREAIMPTFQELSDDTLLKRCIHWFKQNNNESINGIIWKRLPKDVFVGRTVIEIGICSAVVCFDGDTVGVSKIFEELSVDTGQFAKSFCLNHDTSRVKIMDRTSRDEGKLRRG